MSTISFTSNTQNVQDLLASLPAPAKPAVDRSVNEESGGESKPGFNDLLRDSAESQQGGAARSEASETVDTQPRSDTQQDADETSEKPEVVDQEAASDESSDAEPGDASSESTLEQDSEQASPDDAQASSQDTSGDAEVQAASASASAQLDVVDALATDQSKLQAHADVVVQADLTELKEKSGDAAASAQSQSASTNVLTNGVLPNQQQANVNGQAVQAEANAVVQPIIQQGGLAQGDAGDTASDSKSTATAAQASANASTNSNATAAATFAVPDQVGGDARLPMNATSMTQTVDAARQAQAQPGMQAGGSDELNAARLTRGLANAVQQRGGAVTLRLTPPEMGTVRIQMQLTGTNVSASFHAESASAQSLLTNQLANLRSALESKGMSVERLTVQPLAATAQSGSANQSQSQNDTQQQGQSQYQGAGDGRSRGQYNGNASGQQSSDQQQDEGSDGQGSRGFFDQLADSAGDQAA